MKSNIINIITGIILLFILVFLVAKKTQNDYVAIKYRDGGKVNLKGSSFKYQNTSKSSFVKGAWYDNSEDYLILKLHNTYYHYCNFADKAWTDFSATDSYGSYYNLNIKGNYSCRYKEVPIY